MLTRVIAGGRLLFAILLVVEIASLPLDLVKAWAFGLLMLYAGWCALLTWWALRRRTNEDMLGPLWIDGAMLVAIYALFRTDLSLLASLTVLPVMVMALFGNAVAASLLALGCAAALVVADGWRPDGGTAWPQSLTPAMLLLALCLVVAVLARRPRRRQRVRARVLQRFREEANPRHGLQHHVEVLLGLLPEAYRVHSVTLSLHGPEPRVFRWEPSTGTVVLHDGEAEPWRERLAQLPSDKACLRSVDAAGRLHGRTLDIATGAVGTLEATAEVALSRMGAQSMVLPLLSYGQRRGHLSLHRESPPFWMAELYDLEELVREAMPLLERSDLLDQLQRESTAHERERIGRDLHDSAVQPYLGLNYGLEALGERAERDNPLRPHIEQLARLAAEELETLRDVVSGLRRGELHDAQATPLQALGRQVERFQALFGLQVEVVVSPALHLRGAVASAVLHIVNEALTNVRRHTSASSVQLRLELRGQEISLTLRNDRSPGDAPPQAFVPRSIVERTAEFGGSVTLAQDDRQTELTVRLPTEEAAWAAP